MCAVMDAFSAYVAGAWADLCQFSCSVGEMTSPDDLFVTLASPGS